MIIRWVCEDCKRKWLYPLQTCLYCKKELTRQKGTRAKVVAMTTVHIPSIGHPIVPYHVLLLQDEHGNKEPRKSMKSYKIGDMFELHAAKTDSAVVLQRIKYDAKEALAQACGLLRNVDLKKGDKVFIKIQCTNLHGHSISPLILDALLIWLSGKGIVDIVIGEHMLTDEVQDVAAKAGLIKVCEQHQIKFIDISKEEWVEKGKIKIAKNVEQRKLISLAAMKTHAQWGVVGTTENLIRCADAATQLRLYEEGFEKNLPLLLNHLKPILCIGDASMGVHCHNPGSAEPAFLRMLLASKESALLDAAFCEVGMLPLPTYLKNVATAAKSEISIKKIEIVGYEVDALKRPLKKAERLSPHAFIEIIDAGTDPKTTQHALVLCQKMIGVGKSPLALVIGKFTQDMIADKERCVLFGAQAISRGKQMGVQAVAEFTEEMPALQKQVLLKTILEDPNKRRIGIADIFKVKLAEFGN